MRIVFFGASDLGYQCCRTLFEMGENIVGIVSIPKHFRVSYSASPVTNVNFRDFGELAKQQGCPLIEMVSSMKDPNLLQILRSWKPDFGLAIGWYHLVPRSIRDLFPRGVAGIHASLLPKYRGGAPLVWAIINGETRTGVSLFYLDDGVDTGDIISQREFAIDNEDTIRNVYDKAIQASIELVRQSVPRIRSGTSGRTTQHHANATQFPQRSPDDGLIDWSKSASDIRNFIRAQTKPYPGAFTYIQGKKVILWDADITE